MGSFTLIWAGHTVALVGNSVMRFALIIQAWADGGRATSVVLLSLCALLPQIVLSPTAGALIDRLSRRTALLLADFGGLVAVGLLGLVYLSGGMQLWHVYITVALVGAAAAFQYPALASAVPQLVRTDQLQRANGMLSSAKSSAEVGGPALGGLLVALSGLGFIIWVNLVCFCLSLLAVWLVRFHETAADREAAKGPRKRLLADSLEGLRELFARPSLRDLMLVFFVVNLVMVLGFAAVQPMVLARTGNDSASLAAVNTCVGVGGISGGLLLAAWGGPRNRARGMMLGIVGMCLSAQILMASVHGVVAWGGAMMLGALLLPLVNGAMQSIVQTKVPQRLHGRVFGAVVFVSQLSIPLAMAVSGPLADHVFEPQAASESGLVGLLEPLVGSGKGSGMATLLLLAGVLGIAAAIWGMSRRTVRDIDALMPDLDATDTDPADPGPGDPEDTGRADTAQGRSPGAGPGESRSAEG
ncbi:MFS transporter [Streptomyces profundus]|uniref:MFS transporter n=1 Tax=Streptomyces profundus TaxID=2867410 RepID=UPI001D16A07B|nr:MFS transporter [Streptomyces sp. MA3_2.13]UED83921.1 MFS transporter [Streptomyces sp. MA3_2.13]